MESTGRNFNPRSPIPGPNGIVMLAAPDAASTSTPEWNVAGPFARSNFTSEKDDW